MNQTLEEATGRERRTHTFAWVMLGVSAAVAAIEIWDNSGSASTINGAVFGYNIYAPLAFSALIYIAALVLDIAALAGLSGWRNRVVALAGIVVLQIPIVLGIWVAEVA